VKTILQVHEAGPAAAMRRQGNQAGGGQQTIRSSARRMVIQGLEFAPSQLFQEAACLDPVADIGAFGISRHASILRYRRSDTDAEGLLVVAGC
jgi:hypothetical protein